MEITNKIRQLSQNVEKQLLRLTIIFLLVFVCDNALAKVVDKDLKIHNFIKGMLLEDFEVAIQGGGSLLSDDGIKPIPQYQVYDIVNLFSVNELRATDKFSSPVIIYGAVRNVRNHAVSGQQIAFITHYSMGNFQAHMNNKQIAATYIPNQPIKLRCQRIDKAIISIQAHNCQDYRVYRNDFIDVLIEEIENNDQLPKTKNAIRYLASIFPAISSAKLFSKESICFKMSSGDCQKSNFNAYDITKSSCYPYISECNKEIQLIKNNLKEEKELIIANIKAYFTDFLNQKFVLQFRKP